MECDLVVVVMVVCRRHSRRGDDYAGNMADEELVAWAQEAVRGVLCNMYREAGA
jgi:hypothetical protein